jgi:hypothetical protein
MKQAIVMGSDFTPKGITLPVEEKIAPWGSSLVD